MTDGKIDLSLQWKVYNEMFLKQSVQSIHSSFPILFHSCSTICTT